MLRGRAEELWRLCLYVMAHCRRMLLTIGAAQYMTPDDHMGSLVDLEGTDLGVHGGLWRWTVGQRARVAGKSEAHYVAKKQVGPSGQDILVVPA